MYHARIANWNKRVIPSGQMLTEQIVVLLIQERDRINKAIEALIGGVKRRGRPPKNLLTADGGGAGVGNGEPAKKRKSRSWSPVQKKAAAERMKQRWAAKKKAK